MKRNLTIFLGCLMLVGALAADDATTSTYTLVAPTLPGRVIYTTDASVPVSNAWMNAALVFSGGVGAQSAKTVADPNNPSQTAYRLESSEAGFSWERSKPEYHLADVITPPEGVDWNATKAVYDLMFGALTASSNTPGFLLNPDPDNLCVYAIAGGAHKFPWVMANGTTNVVTYTIGGTGSGRPRRIYWTDAPYNAPTISLSGKFVRIFDNGNVTKLEKGTVTNLVGGVETVQENTVISGVYVDESAQVMYAKGKPEGQFVLAYYDTGDYNKVLCVEVIEVARPEAITATGVIGQKLSPSSTSGYDVEGLSAYVTAGVGDSDDARGDYLYQHSGQYSYSPKNGDVFPLRPSVGKRWKAEIYWMETDPMGVQWPFELDQYESDWPTHGHLYVRGADAGNPGAKIYIPSDYTAELGGFQVPEGHAIAVDANNAFMTTGEGWSLLKLTGEDNVWFLPIHSILNTDATYFTREAQLVTVGQEFRIGGGVRSGVATGLREIMTATDDAPGYIYQPMSGTQYNADLYYETTNATADAELQINTDIVGEATNGATPPSAIFAVNTGTNDIEVWWSRRVQADDMPSWIDIPTMVQVYHPVWPEATEAPTLVLASQLGSAGESVFQNYGAATFDQENAALELAPRQYFPNGTGMVSFWTRPSAYGEALNGATNAPSCLLQLGNFEGKSLMFRIGRQERLELLNGTNLLASVAMPTLARPNIWTHIAFSVNAARDYALYVNGASVATGVLSDAEYLKDVLNRCVVGRALDLTAAEYLEDVAEQIDANSSVTPEPAPTVNYVDCSTWAEVKANIEQGQSVRLTADIDQGTSQGAWLTDGADVVLNLNGRRLSGSTLGGSSNRVIIMQEGISAKFTLVDLEGTGCIDGQSVERNGHGGAIYIGADSSCVIHSGTIRNFRVAGTMNGGAIIVGSRSSLVMHGGALVNCRTSGGNGGAVMMTGRGTFVMNGGLIEGCKANLNGGAVCLEGDASFTVKGGTISGCGAENGHGGAVCLHKGSRKSLVKIDGGSLSACTAALRGGAIGIEDGGTLELNGGTISECTAMQEGGAIDIHGSTSVSRGVMNAGRLIGNSCGGVTGGAVAVGHGDFTMNGGAIVKNTAPDGIDAAAGIGGMTNATITIIGGMIVSNVCNGVARPVCLQNSEVSLLGGVLDAEPTAANVNPNEIDGAFAEPLYFKLGDLGFYRVSMGVAVGRQIAEITMRSVVLTAKDVADAQSKILTGSDEGVTGYYSFRSGEDLASIYQVAKGVDIRRFQDRVCGMTCLARNTSLMTPGAPVKKSCVITADKTPTIYYRNKVSEVGYNPNEEHAFVQTGSDGHVVWALRNDLNVEATSKPGVLVSYVQDGEAKMQFFHIAVTNADWSTLAGTCEAGLMLPGPKPLTTMDDPWLSEDYWERDPAQDSSVPSVGYRDRKGQVWARRDGMIPLYKYYRLQEGFWFPQYAEDEQPSVGTAIPWLSVWANPSTANDPLAGSPARWDWMANWPAVENVMKIGQTLYTAADGLPGVYNMKSVSVVYPTPCEETSATETVALTDPTVMQEVAFDHQLLATLGLSTDKNGGLTSRKGKYYFNELPPHLSTRVYVDPTNDKLCFFGEWNEKSAGVSVLYVNVLNDVERERLKKLVPESHRQGTAWETWVSAVEQLGVKRIEPNTMASDKRGEVSTAYTPRDSYALTARGGTGWVTIVENDAPTTNFTAVIDGVAKTVNMGVSAGDAITMRRFFVTNEYYTARVVAKEDEQNLLSQRLTVMYVDSFGGETDDFEFEWYSANPNSDGTIPLMSESPLLYSRREANYLDHDLTRITIGEKGDTLANMVNKYWVCRYRARPGTSAYRTMGDRWSDWTQSPALAEGWVQRVLNNVTPFNQLMTDLYDNAAETTVSMIAKAGRPYTGDVAFNQDALTECGLIELYETLLNKAESMSLLLGENDEGANKQLLLAAERLGDMYTVLGDEAYTDAKNPTIGFGSTMTFSGFTLTQVDFGAASSGLFCFDNQVSSLLDEELALLRGRTAESAPFTKVDGHRVMNNAPYYNRLLWNFTKGVTAGEVAYAVNYNIEGTETVALGEEQAAALYPQGHGDAYGHYLSALKGWYRLLRNPNFSWPRAQGEMNLADTAINVDYYEEAKFAEAALKVVKTAADVVDLTARKAWSDTAGTMAGYRDELEERAFGYGEWANRGAYGALVNWVAANSLLPASSADDENFDALFEDAALARIDRGTVDELAEICTQAAAIQSAEDRIDAGHNPLGLNADAIPFDITPIGANDGTKTHYEQLRERAGTAMANARATLDQAQEYSNRLRMIQESTDAYDDAIAEEEAAYNSELVGYFGKPYSDDCGPGATYAQGYDGPDLIHYMWMDLSKYGLTDVADTGIADSYYFNDVVNWSWTYSITALGNGLTDDYDALKASNPLMFQQSANGLIVKPENIKGTRPRQGSIQEKYAAFLTAYAHYELCENEYEIAVKNYEYEAEWTTLSAWINFGTMAIYEVVEGLKFMLDRDDRWKKKALNSVEYVKAMGDTVVDTTDKKASDVTGAGMTVVTSPKSFVQKATSIAQSGVDKTYASEKLLLQNQLVGSTIGCLISHAEGFIMPALDYYNSIKPLLESLVETATIVNTKYIALSDAQNAVVNAIEAYNSEVAKGKAVLEKREAARKRQVNVLSQARYNDMLFRQLRNQALSRYTASFDLAQKYVWEAAKVYDYETAQLSSDSTAGSAFLDQIVGSRSLGSFDASGKPVVGDVGDTGLAGILAQMDANWLVLKPRLGINNPQPYATWFSLRGECFRILPGAEGDAAWAKELTKHWVDDIKQNADFRRYCQPFQSQFGLKDQEPGLIIPFETTIDFAKNFFGQELAGGDHAYDSTWYATRIYAAGVWFDGYNTKVAGSSTQVALANTPVAYLVPMGMDCMRVPGLDDGVALCFNVVDQVIAAPYAIGSQHLNDLSWFPSASDGDLGGADSTTKIRKHPSFRAYFNVAGGAPTDDKLDCTRLVGRSVWNTKWMLVIPAGSMNADRDKALSIFINGSDTNRDGKLDLKPVSDIRIGFKTYSNSGN